VENLLASTLRINTIFSPLHIRGVIKQEQHEKHLYNQSGYYGKYGLLIIKVRIADIDIKVDVSL